MLVARNKACCLEKVQVGKDQEKAQSEKDSHSKNRGGKIQTDCKQSLRIEPLVIFPLGSFSTYVPLNVTLHNPGIVLIDSFDVLAFV